MNEMYAHVLREVEVLGGVFADAGFELYLVGGIVRDLHLGVSLDALDFDLTTNARPAKIKELVGPLATAVWTQGEKFGTIGAEIGGRPFEITTHRAESYSESSRKPDVMFGDDLDVDLSRRDFTLNAMAIRLPEGELIDPVGGLEALENEVLATPIAAEVSFSDDPLRILRAARFIARYGLRVDDAILSSGTSLIDRMSIVSVERIRDEFDKVLLAHRPSAGFDFLQDVGAWPYVVSGIDESEVPAMGRKVDGSASDLTVRRALVFSHVAEDERGTAISRLRYSNSEKRTLHKLLDAIDGVRTRETQFDARDVRRTVAIVGYDNIDRLAQLLSLHGQDDRGFGGLFNELDANEDLQDLSPTSSGEEVMAALDLEPGPRVGVALSLLQQRRLDDGPLDRDGELEYLRANFSG